MKYLLVASLVALAACSAGSAQTQPSSIDAPESAPVESSTTSVPPHATVVHHDAFMFQVQERLKHLGYYEGEVDGADGPKTRAAVSKFQHDNGLPVTGHVDHHTYSELKLSEGK